MLLRNGTRVEILPTGSRVTLANGAIVEGEPHDTDAYRATARDLGYGDGPDAALRCCQDHDPLHAIVMSLLGFPESYSLLAAADLLADHERPLAVAEETAVIAIQRLLTLAGRSLPLPTA